MVNRIGINVNDHPKGIPHSAGKVIEKLARGNVTCSRATPYKHQAKDAYNRKYQRKFKRFYCY
jgi:hypothetical protein